MDARLHCLVRALSGWARGRLGILLSGLDRGEGWIKNKAADTKTLVAVSCKQGIHRH